MQLSLPLDDGSIGSDAASTGLEIENARSSPGRGAGAAGRADLGPCVFVRHQRARRYILRLDPEGRVRVTIPRGGSRREATAFAEHHREWVARERIRIATRVAPIAPPELRARAHTVLPPRLHEIATQHGLAVTRVSVRNQRTRWGSCGRDGHICLNWRLVLMPDWVSDYVMIHELMHLRRMDHSPAYWRLVAAAYPTYRQARQWLRANGAALR